MLEVKDVVSVVINRETVSNTTADLQTIAIISQHQHFGMDEVYREYGSTTEMIEDGFLTDDFAYIAARRIFSQPVKPASIIVSSASAIMPALLKEERATNIYVQDIVRLLGATNEWFFLITDATSDEDKLAIAEFVETQNIAYTFSDSNTETLDPASKLDIFSQIQALNLQQTFGLFYADSEEVAPEAAWVGRFATAVIGSNVWIHKALATLAPEGFSRTEMSALKSKNAHFYTKVGQDPSVEGNGKALGGEMIHVILGSIWLKVRIAERFWNVLYSKDRLNYTNSSIELFKTELVTVLNEAVVYNILTNDAGFSIQTPDANKLTSQERASGYLRKMTFRARLAGAILFVDGIEGTVYP